jgi:hypothetical protein
MTIRSNTDVCSLFISYQMLIALQLYMSADIDKDIHSFEILFKINHFVFF